MICMICRHEVPEHAAICPHCYAVPCSPPACFLNAEQHQDWLRMQFYPQLSRWREITALREQVAALREENAALRTQLEAPVPVNSAPRVEEPETPIPDETLEIPHSFAVSGDGFCACLQNGVIHVMGGSRDAYRDARDWSGVRMLASGGRFLVGLRADGTVVCTGDVPFAQEETAAWRNVRQIAANRHSLVGLTADDRLFCAGEWVFQSVFDAAADGAHICRVLLAEDAFAVLTERSGRYQLYSAKSGSPPAVTALQTKQEPELLLTPRGCVMLLDRRVRGINLPRAYEHFLWDGIAAPGFPLQFEDDAAFRRRTSSLWNSFLRAELVIFTREGTVGALYADGLAIARLPMPGRNDRLLNVLPLGGYLLCQLETSGGVRTSIYPAGDEKMSVLP